MLRKVLLALAIAAVTAEGAARLWEHARLAPEERERLWVIDNGLEGPWYYTSPRPAGVNSLGFFGPEFRLAKPADVCRVLVVGGDPVVGGWALALAGELARRFPGRRFEVLPGGVPGAGILVTRYHLTRWGVFKPDLVVISGGWLNVHRSRYEAENSLTLHTHFNTWLRYLYAPHQQLLRLSSALRWLRRAILQVPPKPLHVMHAALGAATVPNYFASQQIPAIEPNNEFVEPLRDELTKMGSAVSSWGALAVYAFEPDLTFLSVLEGRDAREDPFLQRHLGPYLADWVATVSTCMPAAREAMRQAARRTGGIFVDFTEFAGGPREDFFEDAVHVSAAAARTYADRLAHFLARNVLGSDALMPLEGSRAPGFESPFPPRPGMFPADRSPR